MVDESENGWTPLVYLDTGEIFEADDDGFPTGTMVAAIAGELGTEKTDEYGNLFAAAPDFAASAAALLSVFDEQAQSVQRIVTGGRSDPELREDGKRAIANLRAALAKAKAV